MTKAPPASLDDLRLALAPALAEAAVWDGWSEAAVRAAAEAEGIDPSAAAFAFAEGPMQMIGAWIASVDAAMARELPADQIARLKIRERIRTLVQFRLDHIAPVKEALRRALAVMARPRNAAQALRLGWNSADAMWRLAGDTATDYNHYTKRMTLGSIYAATLAVYADDTSEGHSETRAFLDRRIEGIMKFEKLKAQVLKSDDERFSPMRLLGRLRYPAR